MNVPPRYPPLHRDDSVGLRPVPAEDADFAALYGARAGGSDRGGAGSAARSSTATTSSTDPTVLFNARNELQEYFGMTVPADTVPLEFWDSSPIQSQFPILSYIARKFLCVLAASTPSERLFSIGGELASCLRVAAACTSVSLIKLIPGTLFLFAVGLAGLVMDKQHCRLGLTTFRSLVLLRANFSILPTVFQFGWDKLTALGVFRGEAVERFVPREEEMDMLLARDSTHVFW
jgi:hypothetical protein